MTALNTQCPPEAVLSDFGLGKLDEASAETVSRHIETCADCRQRVAGVSGDSFVGRLRQAGDSPKIVKRERTYVPGESLANAANSTDGSAEDGLPRPSRTQDALSQASGSRKAPGGLPPSPSSVPPELANHRDYEIIKELGQGGMGTVYLAKNRIMDRLEVLKVISKSLLDKPGTFERFQQEIRSAAKLQHPNIVGAFSVLRPGDLLVFAMEYVRGQDLSAVVGTRGFLPVANATFYIHQVANGLQHAHEKGMVHRDIKPNNLMLAVDGKKHTVKILDFGLAKATSEKGAETGLTKSGQMLGTPDYIAPEQTLNAQKADIRADIYSLGCTLYFLLSGGPPFQETSLFEILKAHHERDPKPLNLVRPDVPVELATVVAKMMAKDPTKRYQTPIEVARVLVPFFKPIQGPEAPRAAEVVHSQTATETELGTSAFILASPIAPPPMPSPIPVAARAQSDHAAPLAVGESADLFGVTIDRHRHARNPRPGRWQLLPPWKKMAAVLAAAAAAILLLGIVLSVRTPRGTILIEISDPNANVTVTVDGNRVDISGLDEPLRLEVGEHTFKVTGDGFETITKKFVVSKESNLPLTITLKPKDKIIANDGRVDLLKLIDPERDAIQGEWKLQDGALICPNVGASLQLPVEPPEEYLLRARVERTTGDNAFVVAFVSQKTRGIMQIDGFQGGAGLELDQVLSYDPKNETYRPGRVFASGPNDLVMSVRKSGVRVECNGVTMIDWIGDAKRLTTTGGWTPPNKKCLLLGGWDSGYRITKLELSPIGDSEIDAGSDESSIPLPKPESSLSKSTVNLLKLINPERDAVRGKTWRLADGELITSAEPFSQLEIPYETPLEYRLTAVAECTTHHDSLHFGLSVGRFHTLLSLDGFGTAISGLEMIDEQQTVVNHTGKPGRLLKDGEPNTIVCTVRKRRIQVTCNGLPLVDWTGNPKRLSLGSLLSRPNPRRLFLGSGDVWRVTRLETIPFPDFECRQVPSSDAIAGETQKIQKQYRVSTAKAVNFKNRLSEVLVNESLSEADSAKRYAMLDVARGLAVAAGNFRDAFKIVDEMADRFELDALRLKRESLTIAPKGDADEAAIEGRADCALQLIAAASAADRFDEAKKSIELATDAAGRLKNIAGRDMQLHEIARRERLLRVQEQGHAAIKADLDTIATNPNDPDANLAVGRYQCFFKGYWETGLKRLAIGSDPVLKSLAQQDLAPRDLAQPPANDEQSAIADGYWDLSREEKAPARNALADRARAFYQRALRVEGDEAIEERLREIGRGGLAGKVQFLSELSEKNVNVAHNGFGKGQNAVELHALEAGGKPAPHSLHMDGGGGRPIAFASVTYDLGRRARYLHAHVGLDETCACEQPEISRLVFHVFGDGELLWKSPPLFGKGKFAMCQVPLDNVQSIELRVACHNNPNCAHAVWVEPEITWAADVAP